MFKKIGVWLKQFRAVKFIGQLLPYALYQWISQRVRTPQPIEARFIRHSKEDVRVKALEACELAKKRFPDKNIYFLSPNDFGIDFCIWLKSPSELQPQMMGSVFLCYYENDDDAVEVLKKIKNLNGYFFALHLGKPASYLDKNGSAKKAMLKTIQDAQKNHLTHIELPDFQNIMQALEVTRHLEGDYVEIGVYMGTSGLAALHYMKESGLKRRCWFMDTFEGFNYDKAKESFDADWNDTHNLGQADETMKRIKRMFDNISNTYSLVKTDICAGSLPAEIQNIAVCNVDVDMYEAILAALDKVAPRIVKGGIIICEDYGHSPWLIGAHLALQEFLEKEVAKNFTPLYLESGQLFLIKNK